MVKWLLKKMINPDTLIEAGVDAGVKKINEALAKGDATVVQRVSEAGERLTAFASRACAYVKDGRIDEAERGEIVSLVGPVLRNAVEKVLE